MDYHDGVEEYVCRDGEHDESCQSEEDPSKILTIGRCTFGGLGGGSGIEWI